MLLRRHLTLLTLGALSLAIIAYLTLAYGKNNASAAVSAPTPKKPGIAVLIDSVKQKNLPIYADSTGTVAAANSVVVRSQVEGQLLEISFSEGAMVKKGEVLARIDPAPYQAKLNESLARKAAAAAALSNTVQELSRYEKLVSEGFTSALILDEKRTHVARQHAALAEVEAQIEYLKIQVSNTTIRAPISGRAGARVIDAGNFIRTSDGAALVQIVQTNPITVNFALPAKLLPEIQAAMRQSQPEVIVSNIEGGATLAHGQLSLVSNEIDQATSQIHLKAIVTNNEKALWPGQSVNVRLTLGVRHKALVVAPAAIQTGPTGRYVYVIRPEQTVERRSVDLHAKDSNWAVIAKGLADGEQVVVDGHNKIEEGSHVATSVQRPR